MELEPGHPLPVTEAMLGTEALSHVPSREKGGPDN